jgi:aryl-alcohol dehydrogenase-like predicted oxidoreductase
MERVRLIVPAWPPPAELRIGLGCMRLVSQEPIAAAADAGITLFDTARAYGGSERLLARALHAHRTSARIITKGGMTRSEAAWIPDGRAKAILSDCEASLAALDGLPIDLYLLHAPDPRTPWRTSVRALARLLEEGLVRRVGVANVSRRQLDEALELAPLAAVQVSLSVYDDHAIRGGILERCAELGIALIAHSPLGGPRRAGRLADRPAIASLSERRSVSPAQAALAWLLSLSPVVVPIPGATRPETARAAAAAAAIELDAEDRPTVAPAARKLTLRRTGTEVVLVMGIQGAGKSRLATEHAERGYVRLNRDERGGNLKSLAGVLDETLSAGASHVVLDNTYLTRAARSHVIEVANRHGVPVRCIWVDITLAQAQVNLVERILDRCGELPGPDELRRLSRREPGLLAPTSQMRSLRELEPPSMDEGFAAVERVAFARVPHEGRPAAVVFVAASAVRSGGYQEAVMPGAPHLVFDWYPGGELDALAPLAARLEARIAGPVQAAHCPHPAGPCWCRPPLPGLALAFARAHAADPERSILVGTTPTHRTLATALGASFLAAPMTSAPVARP